MTTTTLPPVNMKYVPQKHNIGRLRAITRALTQDLEIVLDEAPADLHSSIVNIIRRDVRRAHQLINS